MVDTSRFLGLVAAAGVVYLCAGVLVARAGARRWGVAAAHESRAERWARRGALGLAGAGLLALGWAFLEPHFPEVTRVRIRTPKLRGTRAFRIVQISDLHSDPAPRLEDRLPDLVLGLEPDAVVFTGDAINCKAGLAHFRRCMRGIADQCPTFGVGGNWEAWWFRDADVFATTGVQALNGQARLVRAAGNAVWFAGADVECEDRIGPALAQAGDGFRVLLHHYPCTWQLARKHGADLQLSGDTHGGQVALPLVGPLVRISRYDKAFYRAGLHRKGAFHLYVNRGIGMEGGAVPRVRFLRRPEITLIELVPARAGPSPAPDMPAAHAADRAE